MRFIGLSLVSVLVVGAVAAEPSRSSVPGACAAVDTAFRVCVVDEARTSDTPAERAELRTQIVASLRETLGAGWRDVRHEKVETKVAAKRMKAGECDAVIYFGEKRPRKLRRLDAMTFAVDLGLRHDYASVYLIVSARDFALHHAILTGFPKALSPLNPPKVLWAGR